MKNITPFPTPVPGTSNDVIALHCQHQMHFDPSPIRQLFVERQPHEAEEIVCRMLEDIAARLDMLQHGLAENGFSTMHKPAQRIRTVADQLGLTEVSIAAGHVGTCLRQNDGVGIEATVARLERGFDVAVSEVWNFRDL